MNVERFADLFEGRHDAYGTEEGGCIRDVYETWHEVAECHLEGRGRTPIGVYPMVLRPDVPFPDPHQCGAQWAVKWGCVDFDVKSDKHKTYDYETPADAHRAALNLVKVLNRLAIYGSVERTRSNGRHVWVFADEWVPAAHMRRALLVACDVAGVSNREVNPKNEALAAPDTLGNYVRLPYPGVLDRRTPPARLTRTFISANPDFTIRFEDFNPQRTSVLALEKAAALYVPPAPPRPIIIERDYRGPARLSALTKAVLEGGPLGDRSTWLVKLAHLCREDRLPEGEALAVVYDGDERCGKFVGRRDRAQRIADIVRKAYA
jgi:hypothetical protein